MIDWYTYSFKNGANLESSKGFHELVWSGVAHTEFERQNATFLHREVCVEVAQVDSFPLFYLLLRRWQDVWAAIGNELLHERDLPAWHHLSHVALQNLPLHWVHGLHESVEGLRQLDHLEIFCLSLLSRHLLSSLMSSDHFGQELFLLLQWHALHSLCQTHLLLIGHRHSNLIKLLLQLVPVLVSLLLNLFLCLLLILFLLLVVHRLDNLLNLWSDFLKSFVCFSELSLIHIYSILICLKVAHCLI